MNTTPESLAQAILEAIAAEVRDIAALVPEQRPDALRTLGQAAVNVAYMVRP